MLGSKHNSRARTAYSNIVSLRKHVSSEEGATLHSFLTNSSVKGAQSMTFVSRSRRIQSAGSAEEEIMKAKEERRDFESVDGKLSEAKVSKSVFQTTSMDVDGGKSDSTCTEAHKHDGESRSDSGEKEKSRELKNRCLPHQDRNHPTCCRIIS